MPAPPFFDLPFFVGTVISSVDHCIKQLQCHLVIGDNDLCTNDLVLVTAAEKAVQIVEFLDSYSACATSLYFAATYIADKKPLV